MNNNVGVMYLRFILLEMIVDLACTLMNLMLADSLAKTN